MARRAHTGKKKKRRKENKRNPADKSKIVLAFIWTCGDARLRLNPNETAACPGWIHHRWIGVISTSTFNQAPLSICGRPSPGPTASIRSLQDSAQGALVKYCLFCLSVCHVEEGVGHGEGQTRSHVSCANRFLSAGYLKLMSFLMEADFFVKEVTVQKVFELRFSALEKYINNK